MAKVRASLWLTKDIFERAKALSNEVPAFSVSAIVDGMLHQIVPQLERTIELAKAGDREAMLQFMDTFSATMLAQMGSELSTVRRELQSKAEEGDET